MKKSMCMPITAATLAFVGFAPACAQDDDSRDGSWETSANVALTTDYRYRGVSQTDKGPAIQGGFDAESSSFYVGAWGSSVDFGDDTTMEIDFYGGFTPNVGAVSLDLGVIYYAYPDSPDNPDQNFVEAYLGGETSAGESITLSGSISYSPDFYLEVGDAIYATIGGAFAVNDTISIDANVGFSRFDNDVLADDYDDYNIGVTGSAFDFGWDVRFHDTSGLAGGDDESIVATISKRM